MAQAKNRQRCTKCREVKELTAFRRQRHRANGRDSICRACRQAAYQRAKAKTRSFGPLPEPEGSEEWVSEIQRRAAEIRAENIHDRAT